MKKLIKFFSFLATIALALVSSKVWAEDAKPVAPTITVGGLVDTYYTYNFTNGNAGMKGMGNAWGPFGILGSYFNTKDESFELGMAEVSVTATQGNASAHVVLNMGQEANLIIGAANGFQVWQAYVSYVADQWTFNAGRMATWMGNEVIESKSNWNYSRSSLFWATIPHWHAGLSVNFAPDAKLGLTGYIVDGWNNWGTVTSATSSDLGKTYGLQVAIKPDSTFSIILNGIVGPGGTLTTADPTEMRYVGELIVSLAASDKFSLALDAEYFSQAQGAAVTALTGWGVDLYGRYQIESDWALALRLEEIKDSGYVGVGNTTTQGEIRTATLTVEHNFTPNLLARVEGRMDMQLYNGVQLTPTTTPWGWFAGNDGTQSTASASMVFSF